MSVKADEKASPQQAQAVVNVGPGEQAPKQVEYENLTRQLQELEKQIKGEQVSDAEVEALKKKVAELESEVAKRATKRSLSKKISELSKWLEKEGEEAEAEEAKKGEAEAEEAKRTSGKGIVAVDEISRDMLGNYDWFKDLLKAHKRLVGFQ